MEQFVYLTNVFLRPTGKMLHIGSSVVPGSLLVR